MNRHHLPKPVLNRYQVLPAPPGARVLVADGDLIFIDPIGALAVPNLVASENSIRLQDDSTLVWGLETGSWWELGTRKYRYCVDLSDTLRVINGMLNSPSDRPDCDLVGLRHLRAEVALQLDPWHRFSPN